MGAQATILVIEDNEDDAALLRRSFTKAKVLNPIHFVRTAEDAVAYLTGAGKYKNRSEFPLPSLILVDLKLPGMSGHEFLRWVRTHETLRNLRVVVLSGSDEMREVNLAYQLGANSFLIKPADFERFVEISLALDGFWVWLDKAPDGRPMTDTEVLRRRAQRLPAQRQREGN